jgi:hypothetical protein
MSPIKHLAKFLSPLFVAALLLATATQSAQAAPHWQVEGSSTFGTENLTAVSTTPVTLHEEGGFTFKSSAGNCTAAGSIHEGNTNKETLTCVNVEVAEFEEFCQAHSPGQPAGKIVTNPLTSRLISSSEVSFAPETGEVFATIEIEGAICPFAPQELPVTGEVVGIALPAEKEEKTGTLTFPEPPVAVTNPLKLGENKATFAGTFDVSLTSGKGWGIFGAAPEPLPNGTAVTGFKTITEGGKEVPVINWEEETPITTDGCEGGKVTVSVEAENPVTHEFETREASLTETEAGKFGGKIPIMHPLHGHATVRIKITGCKEPSLEIEVKFECWIDPSGKVVDGSHEGVPLWDATVTLLSSATKEGTYTAVPSGSEVMSPANRVNPDKSRVNGEFGWDVEEGWYKVEAAKPGCGTATTEALFVPPPQENLEIVLHCEGEQWKLGEEPGEIAQLSVAAPAKLCDGQMRVENVSFGAASIKVLKETGIECTLKKACEGKALKPGEKCESELEGPGVKPEYELEVEWNGEKFIKRFPA